jgi:hypothetical protein
MTANEFSRYASKRRTAEAHPCIFRQNADGKRNSAEDDNGAHRRRCLFSDISSCGGE